jgi:anaerobic magnesium-protoporphyrin IX monomethyl ester cyclase
VNILLISQNQEKVPYPVLPIGLCYVAEALEKAGHRVSVVDLCFDGDVRRGFAGSSPDLIGIGVRNMDNCDYWRPKNFIPDVRRLVETCRGLSRAPILIGGSAVSVMPAEILKAVGADYAITGDGERAAVEFAAALARGEDPRPLPGVCSLSGETVRVNPQNRVPALDVNLPPRMYRWVDVRPYLKYEGVYPLQSKRGCALKCIYCTYTNIEGKLYRMKSGEHMADEIQDVMENSPVRDFEFVDSTFNLPESHALDICDAVIRRKLGARFIGSGLNPVSVSETLLERMKTAGFSSLICTAESASDRVIGNLQKGFTRKHIERIAVLTRRVGLRTLWIFLVGGPGETRETVLETLDFFHRHAAPGDVAFVSNGIRIYPNTAMSRIALAEGVIRSDAELVEPTFYFSPGLDRDWLHDTMKAHARMDPRLVTSESSQSPLVPFGLRLLSLLGVRKPFWRFAPVLNRVLRCVS